jgi:hypothetical protein
MIYEIRTYRLKVGSLAEVEKRYGEAYEYRRKYSELWGFFHTEIGPLNEIIHIWSYPDLGERARVRAASMKDPNWPPKIQEFITGMTAEIVVPFPFSPELRPGTWGPIYEYRSYTVKAGSIPNIIERWEPKVPDRVKLSPLALVGSVEFGTANKYVHIWPYQSLEQRSATRAKAVQTGVWPPPGGAEVLLTQENKIMLPSAFSPRQ